VGLAAKIFCRKIIINHPENLKMDGPLLLGANHPNSFLDAILLDILFQKSIWSLTRGDMFKKPFYIRLLKWLKMLPVYRTSEGVENLDINYKTFDACKEIFKKKGVVLMFSEGKCINEWHLRPLKKGTARLAIGSWQDGIDVKVLPVGINYSSFRRFGKNIFINFGTVITQHDIDMKDTEGKKYFAFNNKLQQELQQLVFEIPHADKQLKEKLLTTKPGTGLKVLLFLPALAGLIINAPLYLPVRFFTRTKAGNSDHYDSILISLLIFLYPLYLFLSAAVLIFITHSWISLLVLLAFPFTAWCYVQLKGQLDKTA
jgi:1-acyl-sn-glycerol-3-phosphate acyltransferase